MSSQKKRLYLAFLLLGAVALMLDRFVFSGGVTGPETAIASTGQTGATPIPGIAGDEKPSIPIPKLRFPVGLTPVGPDWSIRDLFLPPTLRAQWESGSATDEKNASGPETRPDRAGRDEFYSRHRADGVIEHERLTLAIVDGLWMQIGQTLDGCRLEEASENEVRFECFDGEVVLRVIQGVTDRRR